MSGIFKNNADLFLEKGYPAIPCEQNSKAPVIKNFTRHARELPDPITVANWKHNWPNGNIGVVMGGGLAMVDVDGDEAYVRLVKAVINRPTCTRFGSKGMGYIISVQQETKTQRFKNSEGKQVIELIAEGAQIIVPPSVHPDNGKAYEWQSKPLYEYSREELAFLSDEKIAFLKALISMPEHLDIINGGPTHVAARNIAWRLADFVDEETFCAAIEALLPTDYSGDLLERNQLRNLYRSAKEDPDRNARSQEFAAKQKQSKTDKVFELLEKNGVELFHDKYKTAYLKVKEENKGPCVYVANSTPGKLFLKSLFYRETGKILPRATIDEIADSVSAKAFFDGSRKEIYNRVAGFGNAIYINMGDEDHQVVCIDETGVQITKESPVVFMQAEGMAALPVPVSGQGDALKEFQLLLGIDDDSFLRLLAFLINCLRPQGPYFFLLLEGEQGSGKSFLCTLIKALIDPSEAAKLRMPDTERDLMIMAKHIYMLVFDNVSGIKPRMSDAFCTLSTGGGFGTRKLYSDDSLQFLDMCRPYVMNGINGVGDRPDIFDRSIAVRLKSMPEGQRKTEQQMQKVFDELRPRLLHKLYELVSCALRNIDAIEAPTTIRMADATKWITAAEPATGLPPGTLLKVLEGSQQELIGERMTDNPIAVYLHDLVESGPQFFRVGDLFELMKADDRVRYDRSFPSTSMYFSQLLERMRIPLEKVGIIIRFEKKSRDGRHLSVYLVEDEHRVESLRAIYLNSPRRKRISLS